jgi:hypothetical protein
LERVPHAPQQKRSRSSTVSRMPPKNHNRCRRGRVCILCFVEKSSTSISRAKELATIRLTSGSSSLIIRANLTKSRPLFIGIKQVKYYELRTELAKKQQPPFGICGLCYFSTYTLELEVKQLANERVVIDDQSCWYHLPCETWGVFELISTCAE